MKYSLTTWIGVVLVAVALPAWSQNKNTFTVQGCVRSDEGLPVGYATMILVSAADSTLTYGTVSDDQGMFKITAPWGEYVLNVSFLGYDNLKQPLHLTSDTDLGELVLPRSSITLDEVVVRGNLITREADRFVMNLTNSPLAIGRDGQEILQQTPGVWVNDDGQIKVFGREGTRVMVNDRLLRESGEELAAYLRALKAEDIQKIEVIPYAGSEYDADMKGGVIKITMKKQRENGMTGAVSMRYSHALAGNGAWQMQPSFNLRYRYNKFSLYTDLSLNRQVTVNDIEGLTRFEHGVTQQSSGRREGHSTYQSVQLGFVYDIDDRQSLGAEINMNRTPRTNTLNSLMNVDDDGNETDVSSTFVPLYRNNRFSVLTNYILQLDTVGSKFKLLFDFNRRYGDNETDYRSYYRGFQNFDTVYRNSMLVTNEIYAVNGDFEVVLSKASKLRTGLKYSHNNMYNDVVYQALQQEQWNDLEQRNYINWYDENIGALYLLFSTKFRNSISLAVGMRGEYTHANLSNNKVENDTKQTYFSFFPNVNLSVPLNEKASHTLALSYSRKISRPSFSDLNPYRIPLSEYAFAEGNAYLKPTYINDCSLAWIIAQKYVLTLGAQFIQDQISQLSSVDTNDPDVILYRKENVPRMNFYYANITLPVNIFKWWRANVNLNFEHLDQELDGEKQSKNSFNGDMTNTFTLWGNWYFDLKGYYVSSLLVGNYRALPMFRIDAALKRSFSDNRFTVSLNLDDIFNSQKMTVLTEASGMHNRSFMRTGYRMLGLSFRYNFKAGKSVKVKNLESGAKEEKSRL